MSNPLPRRAYFLRIDEALESRNKLACAIEALAAETQQRAHATDVEELLRTLRGQPTTEQFINEGGKAVWLPLVLHALPSSTASGDFKQLFNDLTSANQIQKRKWLQFAYPLVVLALAVGLFVVLANTVIPVFQSMFREFELKLPAATQFVFGIGSTIQTQPLLSILWLLGLILVFLGVRKLGVFLVRRLEATTLVGPLLSGNSESVRAMGRLTSTLAELLQVGAPLNEAILIAGRASLNPRFMHTSKLLSEEIGSSRSLDSGSSVVHNFPALVFQALEAGPNKTPSIPLLRQLSTVYFERVRQRVEWSGELYAPLAIIGIGFVIGFVVIALFMPLISLITSLN